jgi:hypothetical protein
MHLLIANNSASGGGLAGAFESIASATGTGSSGTITFSSIPQTYQHLQIRIMANDGGNNNIGIRFNGDSGTNYANHKLEGDGSAVAASANTSVNRALYVGQATGLTDIMGVSIVDIHDYASSTKNTTVRSLVGWDSNNDVDGGYIRLTSGLFNNTASVTSISLVDLGGNFTTTSIFALYGIKAAA